MGMSASDGPARYVHDELHLDVPSADVVRLVLEARERGVVRFVSGFLPDEVSWHGERWNEALNAFLEGYEFRPQLFSTTPNRQSDECILAIGDGPAVRLAVELAEAIAATTRRRVASVDPAGVTAGELTAALDTADIIVSACGGWWLGFAVEEYVWRSGGRFLRLVDPGYSPIRSAAYGIALEHGAAGSAVPSLRELVGRVLRRDPATTPPDRSERRPSAAWWRSIYTRLGFREFWVGFDHESAGTARGVHDRAIFWSALESACSPGGVDAKARADLMASVARRCVVRRDDGRSSAAAEVGAGRFARMQPEWMHTYRTIAKGGPEVAAQVRRWVHYGGAWPEPAQPVWPMIQAANWAWENGGAPEAAMEAVVRAWAEGNGPSGTGIQELSPAFRLAALEAVLPWLAVQTGRQAARPTWVDAWCSRSESDWVASFGAAAPCVRLMGAARVRSTRLARAALRPLEGALGRVRASHLARLIRAALPGVDAQRAWLRRAVLTGPDAVRNLVTDLTSRWLARRKTELWRRVLAADTARESAAVVHVVAALAEVADGDAYTGDMVVRIAALAGRADIVSRAWPRLPGAERRRLAWPVTAGLWLRGRCDGMRALLDLVEEAPDTPGDTLFNLALVWQMVGEPERVAGALRSALTAPVRPLQPDNLLEGQQAWLAVMLKQHGQAALAARLAQPLRAAGSVWLPILDETAAGDATPAAAWRELGVIRE